MSSVIVTPLQPPFTGEWVRIGLNKEMGKDLALSPDDARRVKALLSGNPIGRHVIMEAVGEQIKISVLQ